MLLLLFAAAAAPVLPQGAAQTVQARVTVRLGGATAVVQQETVRVTQEWEG